MVSHHLERATTNFASYWTWWWEATSKKDQVNQAVLTVLIAIFATLWYLWESLRARKRTAPLPPGPRGLPIVGYLPFLGPNLHHSFAELADIYGPIFKLWLGNRLCIVLSSPSLAKEVARDQDIIFANRDPPVAALITSYGGLDIAWSPYGSYWRNLRKLFVREMLSNNILDRCYAHRRYEVRKTITNVYNKIGTPMDIGKLSFQTELNVMTRSMWGSTIEGLEDSVTGVSFRESSNELMRLLGKPNISDFFPVLSRFDIQGVEREMKKVFLSVVQILDHIIEQRMKLDTAKEKRASNDREEKDFLQFLLDVKEQEATETPITRTQIKALLVDILVGGTDTTATTIEWAMAEMMSNPEIMRKAQEELADVVGMTNIVEESHLPKLKYMDAVMKETLRLHPTTPLLMPKCPSESCTVGGYTVPKGTKVFVNVWAMHRDPKYWDNPSEFKPERFLTDSSRWDYRGNNFQYLPFGSGRRVCPGIPLAERMLIYLLGSLLHSFDWQLIAKGEDLDLSEQSGIVVKKRTPLIVIPTKRLPNSALYA
ncbi:hypothetical protein PVL29_001986 [Vitis rotundifolia]|uniref:Uncharacterized protein n=2 Tax=Vitis rotundifolia TaxID=103349 RepID=A0AA39AI22_VITRO|nr:hypothetical protein PVL29_001986 [Vitis rotundifolia]